MVAREERGCFLGRARAARQERERRPGHVLGHRDVVARHPRVRQRLEDSRQPLRLRRDRGAHRDAELRLEPAQVVADAARLCLVVHVQHEHRRNLELPELQRDEQRAPEVLRVGHLHDHGAVRAADRAHEVPRDLLVLAHREERVQARRVDDLGARREPTAVDLDRGARVVGDGGAKARERVEEGTLADVRVAEEDDALRGRGRARRRVAGVVPLRFRPDRRQDPFGHIETRFQLRCHYSRSPSVPASRCCVDKKRDTLWRGGRPRAQVSRGRRRQVARPRTFDVRRSPRPAGPPGRSGAQNG